MKDISDNLIKIARDMSGSVSQWEHLMMDESHYSDVLKGLEGAIKRHRGQEIGDDKTMKEMQMLVWKCAKKVESLEKRMGW